jgi:hypothetical protein
MKRFVMTCVALLMCGCVTLPWPRQHPRAFEIENLHSGFAFKGKLTGQYYLEDDHVRVDVSDWQIRFGCRDQEGRQLDSVYFALARDRGTNRFTQCVYGDKIPINQYVSRTEGIALTNLSFTVPLDQIEDPQHTWLVAVYERVSDGVPGRCYAHHRDYLFSRKETKFHRAKMHK